jgi:hypothetical protein
LPLYAGDYTGLDPYQRHVFFLELGLSAQYLDRVFDMFGIVPARFTHPEWAESVTSI